MDELLDKPWLAALVVLITQIIFLYARTLNIMFTADGKMIPTLVTGSIISITWLISIAIGANAVMTMQYQPVLAHLIGGLVGVVMGFRHRKK